MHRTMMIGAVAGMATMAGAQTFDFGQYEGQWDNITFGSTGAAKLLIEDLGGGDVSMTLDFDGNVFGGSDPDPVKLTGSLVGDIYTLDTLVAHPVYGTVDGGVDAAGDLSFDLVNPSGGFFGLVTLRGTAIGKSIQFDYDIYPVGASAPTIFGEVNMRLVPSSGGAALAGAVGLLAARRRRR